MPSHLEESLARQLLLCGITGFEREYRFDAVRLWRFDFAWPEFGILAEVHGGEFAKIPGGHNRGAQMASDREKQNAATLAGWILVEFTGKHVDAAPLYVAETLGAAFTIRARHDTQWSGQTAETRVRGVAARVSAAAASNIGEV